MVEEIEPEIVLVYGSMPEKIFGKYKGKIKFKQYKDYISKIKKASNQKK